MTDYFTLNRTCTMEGVVRDQPQVATAATIDCGLCGGNISGMGGPDPGAVCWKCGEALRSGRLRGVVKRD